jgi:hypothetical protein
MHIWYFCKHHLHKTDILKCHTNYQSLTAVYFGGHSIYGWGCRIVYEVTSHAIHINFLANGDQSSHIFTCPVISEYCINCRGYKLSRYGTIIITNKSQVSVCYGKFLIYLISIKCIVYKKTKSYTPFLFFSLPLYAWSIWPGILIHLIWIIFIHFITRICLLLTIPIFSLIILFACSIWSGDPRITNTLSAGFGGGLRSNSQCAPVCWLICLIVSPPAERQYIKQNL